MRIEAIKDHKGDAADPLLLMIFPSRSTGYVRPYLIDLRLFRDGGVRQRATEEFQIIGRPGLIQRLLPGIKAMVSQLSANTYPQVRRSLICFWKFLGYLEELRQSDTQLASPTIEDLDWTHIEHIWPYFTDWLSAHSGRTAFELCVAVRKIFYVAHGEWKKTSRVAVASPFILPQPFVQPRQSESGFEYTEEEIRSMRAAITNEVRSALKRIQDGRQQRTGGKDIREVPTSADRKLKDGPISELPNRLEFAWNIICSQPTISKDDLRYIHYMGNFRSGAPASIWSTHIKDKVPGGGFGAHTRWLFLDREDLMAVVALVILRTGLNQGVVFDLRRDRWFYDHPQHPERAAVIFGPKWRANGRHEMAYSLKKPRFDTFRLIATVIELTEPLAVKVRRQIAEIEHKLDAPLKIDDAERMKLRVELGRLRDVVNRVWLFPRLSPAGKIDALNSSKLSGHSGHLSIVIEAIFDRHGLRSTANERLVWSSRAARSAWAVYLYRYSGYHLLLTKLGLGHKSLDTLTRYLDRRISRVNRRKELINLQGHVLREVRSGQLDPIVLKHLVAKGEITAEQRERIRNWRYRTSKGVQCIDPYSPDLEADPTHRRDTLCSTQNCFSCSKWYATIDSIDHLWRLVMDLEEARTTLSAIAWETSDYPEWLDIARYILGKFDASLRDTALTRARNLPRMLYPLINSAQGIK